MPSARRIRLLVLIGSMGGGGAERQVVNLLHDLDRNGFEPILYLVYRTGPLLAEIPADVPVIAFDRHPVRTGWRSLFSRIPGQLRRDIIADLTETLRRERIDCVYDRTYHMTMLAAPACRAAHVPRVSTVVSDPKSDFDLQEKRFRFIKRRLLMRAYREAERIVTVSEGVREGILAEYAPRADRVITIYNPVDFDRIATRAREPLPEEMRAVFDAPGARHLVAAGRLQVEKRFDQLITAFAFVTRAQREPLRLHLLGEGPLRPELTALAARLGVADCVHLWGFQPNPFPAFARAELLVLSSHHEGFPGVLVEALAAGAKGLVATDCPHGPREILDGGRCGWLVPRDNIEALSRGIEEALRDPKETERRSALARDHVRALCSREATLSRLEGLLETVVREHNPAWCDGEGR
jgi:glycosyltransferase involved in cell wall biosynthesis